MLVNRKTFAWRNFLVGLREIVRQERNPEVALPYVRRLQAWRHGFLSSSWKLYGFGKAPDPDYMPDFPNLLFARRINRDQQAFNNKILFRALFGGLIEIPANLCLVDEGRFLPLPDCGAAIVDLDSLLGYCRSKGAVVFKPLHGLSGRGVHLIRHDPGTGYLLDGEPATEDRIRDLARSRRDFLVCAAVRQGRYADRIFPDAANTVRINTMIDPATGKGFLAQAFHRFGTRKSVPVDNWAAGGLLAPIELETGLVGAATAKPVGGRVHWIERHPDTGVQIAGVPVPGWSAVVARLVEVTEAYHDISHCAWDVVVREDGFAVLEGNNLPSMPALQLKGGLLRDERIRRFYGHHEVLRPRAAAAALRRNIDSHTGGHG